MAGICGFEGLDTAPIITAGHSAACGDLCWSRPVGCDCDRWHRVNGCGMHGGGPFAFEVDTCLGSCATGWQRRLFRRVLGVLAARLGNVTDGEERTGAALVVMSACDDMANVVGGLAQDVIKALRCDESISFSVNDAIARWRGAVLAASLAGVCFGDILRVSQPLYRFRGGLCNVVARWVVHDNELCL